MKRLFVSILAILYFALSCGATVHVQYCMGKMVRVSLVEDESDDCDHCGMKKDVCKKKCCKEEKKTMKSSNQNSQSHLDLNLIAKNFVYLPSYIPFTNTKLVYEPKAKGVFLAHAPPSVWRTCPIYIQVRNFRI